MPNSPENFRKQNEKSSQKEIEEQERREEEERNRNDAIQRELTGQRPRLDDVPGFDPNLRTREREPQIGGAPDPLDPRNDRPQTTTPNGRPAIGTAPRGGSTVALDNSLRNACGPADLASVDEFIRDLATAARAVGLAPGTTPPSGRDADAQRRFEAAIGQEAIVQGRLIREVATLQGNVARNLNNYLAAASAWQERYAYISSSTTYMQGMLTEWMEAREIYEKADFAFAMANLGMGLGKLGFKGIRYLTRTKTAAAAVQGTEATAAAAGTARAAEGTAASALGETQAFNRTIIPPGQNPAALTKGGQLAQSTAGAANAARTGAGAIDEAAELARLQARYDRELAQTRQMFEAATKDGASADVIQTFKTSLDDLIRDGRPTSLPPPPPPPPSPLAQATAAIGDDVAKLAQEAGVDTSGPIRNLVGRADDVDAVAEAEWEILRAVARARGWHDVPAWGVDAIGRALLEARKGLAGVEGAAISPANVEILRSLKTYVESQGFVFARWLETAGGELAVAGRNGEDVIEGIALYYDKADIDLLLKIIDTGGDITQLRNAVGQVAQASLNGLARGTPGLLGGTCATAADGALIVNRAVSPGTLTNPSAVAAQTAMPPVGAPPTDAQLQNVLYGTGQLGQVGLGNVVDQFGVTDRFTAGQGFGRAVMGELWELVTSPSATVASHYYTLVVQSEYLDLLRRDGDKLVDIGVKLDDAARALRDLQVLLQGPNVTGANSFLNAGGPAQLRKVLDDMQRAYDSGSEEWKRNNKERMDERRDHMVQKLADLVETMDDLKALVARLGQVRMWLELGAAWTRRQAKGAGRCVQPRNVRAARFDLPLSARHGARTSSDSHRTNRSTWYPSRARRCSRVRGPQATSIQPPEESACARTSTTATRARASRADPRSLDQGATMLPVAKTHRAASGSDSREGTTRRTKAGTTKAIAKCQSKQIADAGAPRRQSMERARHASVCQA